MIQDRPWRDVNRERCAEAQRLFRMAYARQLDGNIEQALVLYEKSVRLHATAEACTYLGWVKSTKGALEEAIQHCFDAMALNPSFANAWNDVGAYLIELDRAGDALFYLKRATRMSRQPTRCFPHYNLHRAYLALGDRPRAIDHLYRALDADPDFTAASDALNSLMFPHRTSAPVEPRLVDAALVGTPVLLVPPQS